MYVGHLQNKMYLENMSNYVVKSDTPYKFLQVWKHNRFEKYKSNEVMWTLTYRYLLHVALTVDI